MDQSYKSQYILSARGLLTFSEGNISLWNELS